MIFFDCMGKYYILTVYSEIKWPIIFIFISKFAKLPGFHMIIYMCLDVIWQTVETSSDFCNVTRSTKKVVPDCPDSVDKWNEASERKNCTQYASQCSEPEKLEYHCVINPFINETLEVCAYGQYIISGSKKIL